MKYLLYKIKFLFFCSFLIPSTVISYPAEDSNISFQCLDVKDGIPHQTVFGIMQDYKGFIWFGTRNGIARYDGKKIKVYQNDKNNSHSLSHNDSGGILQDSQKKIWIRTWGGGLNRLNPETEKFERFVYDKNNPESISSNTIQVIYEDRTGNLWAGTFKNGLNRFHRDTRTFTRYINDPKNKNSISNNRIWAVIDDSQSNIWIATDHGLNRLDHKTGAIKRFFHNKNHKNTIKSNKLRMLSRAPDGLIWIASDKGIDLFNPFTGKTEDPGKFSKYPPFSDTIVNYIFQDKSNRLWAGTMEKGIFKIDLKTGKARHFYKKQYFKDSISHNDIRVIFQDKTGTLWFATRGGGVCSISENLSEFYSIINEFNKRSIIPNNNVYSILFDKSDNMWTGTWYGGLGRYDTKKDKLKIYSDNPLPQGPGCKDINAILQGKDNSIYIGSWASGLKVYNPENKSFHTIKKHLSSSEDKGNVTSIAEDKEGYIWTGSSRDFGIYRYNPISGQTKLFDQFFSGNDIKDKFFATCLYYDKLNDILYAGLNDNIIYFDKKHQRFTRLRLPPNFTFKDYIINSINFSEKSGLLVGTYGKGLAIIDKENLVIYSRKNGLSGNIIKSIIKDENDRIFIATENGISYFNEESQDFKNFYLNKDFSDNAWAVDKNGDIFVGSKEGIVKFSPDNLNYKPISGRIHITSFRLFNRDIKPNQKYNNRIILSRSIEDTETINLEHNENFFSISFSVTDYSSNNGRSLSYMLEGYERKWTQATEKYTVSYSNLSSGKYRFIVKDLNYPNNIKSININISPPFWQRWYFSSSLFLLIAGSIFFFTTRRFRRIKSKNRGLEKIVSERTKELESRNRQLKILSVTDPLTGIINRRGFIERAEIEFKRFRRNKSIFSLILCDIDYFKKINDNYGHDYGDYIIKEISSILKNNIREQDSIGRWGGEEFILLLPDTDSTGAMVLGEKLRKIVEEYAFKSNRIESSITVTLGISEIKDEMELDDLISNADKALYSGKKTCRNCVVQYFEENHINLI